jgi:hypothetical protein
MSNNESATEKKIRLAIIRLEHNKPAIVEKDKKISLSAVANEAGVDRRTIDLYPKLRERIEGNVSARKRRDVNDKQKMITELREKLSLERKVNGRQKDLINDLCSEVSSMDIRINELEGLVRSKNITVLNMKKNEDGDMSL